MSGTKRNLWISIITNLTVLFYFVIVTIQDGPESNFYHKFFIIVLLTSIVLYFTAIILKTLFQLKDKYWNIVYLYFSIPVSLISAVIGLISFKMGFLSILWFFAILIPYILINIFAAIIIKYFFKLNSRK